MKLTKVLIEKYIMEKYDITSIEYGTKAYENYENILEILSSYSRYNKIMWSDMIFISNKLIKKADELLELK